VVLFTERAIAGLLCKSPICYTSIAGSDFCSVLNYEEVVTAIATTIAAKFTEG
jgi:hypothetical protein